MKVLSLFVATGTMTGATRLGLLRVDPHSSETRKKSTSREFGSTVKHEVKRSSSSRNRWRHLDIAFSIPVEGDLSMPTEVVMSLDPIISFQLDLSYQLDMSMPNDMGLSMGYDLPSDNTPTMTIATTVTPTPSPSTTRPVTMITPTQFPVGQPTPSPTIFVPLIVTTTSEPTASPTESDPVQANANQADGTSSSPGLDGSETAMVTVLAVAAATVVGAIVARKMYLTSQGAVSANSRSSEGSDGNSSLQPSVAQGDLADVQL